MKNYKYKVVLKGYSTIVYAGCEKEAVILAQAEAIKEGRNYEFVSIKNLSDLGVFVKINYVYKWQ